MGPVGWLEKGTCSGNPPSWYGEQLAGSGTLDRRSIWVIQSDTTLLRHIQAPASLETLNTPSARPQLGYVSDYPER